MRYVTPTLTVVPHKGISTPRVAYSAVLRGITVGVSSDEVAKEVLILLGLSDAEAQNRIDLSKGEGSYS